MLKIVEAETFEIQVVSATGGVSPTPGIQLSCEQLTPPPLFKDSSVIFYCIVFLRFSKKTNRS